MDLTKYPPSTQLERAADILRVLFANGAYGVTPSALGAATKLSASYVTQMLGMLANLRLAEEVGETGRWRAGVAWSQMALSLMTSIKRDLDSVQEYQQRVTRSSN